MLTSVSFRFPIYNNVSTSECVMFMLGAPDIYADKFFGKLHETMEGVCNQSDGLN